MRFKRMMGALLSISMAVGTVTLPVHAEVDKKAFFDSVQRYISFDDSVEDYFDHELTPQNVSIDAGKYGNAGRFDGSSSNVNLGKLDYTAPKAFSVSFWMNPDAGNGDDVVVGNKDWESYKNPGWLIGMPKENYVKINATESLNSSNCSVTPGEWVYVTAVFDLKDSGDSTAILYLNGKEAVSGKCTASAMNTAYNTYIGRDSAASKRYYKGLIDEFILCEKALSPEEIEYAMNLSDFDMEYKSVGQEPYCILTQSSGRVSLQDQNEKVPLSFGNLDASSIHYRSLDEAVAKVSADGIITPVAMGDTTIEISCQEGDFSYQASYVLTVTGNSYRMAERTDKENNPSDDGWAFMYAPSGTVNQYEYMQAHDTSNGKDIWRKSTDSADQYTRLNASGKGHHPGPDNDVVIRWTAPEEGFVRINGTILATAYSASNRDGINLTVIKNEDTDSPLARIYTSYDDDFASGGKKLDKTIAVKTGDQIYFRIDKDVNNSSDGFDFDPVIAYVKPKPEISLNVEEGSVKLGETITVPLNIIGDIDTSKIQYTSLNTAAAVVSGNGVITPVAPGNTVIQIDYDFEGVSFHGLYGLSVTGQSYSLTDVPADVRGKQPSYGPWAMKYTAVGQNDYKMMGSVLYTSAGVWRKDADSTEPRLSFEGTNHHPSAEYDPAIEWTAPEAGTVHITGPFVHSGETSDGIKLSLIHGNGAGYSTITTMTSLKADSEKQMDSTVKVEKGDKIYFRLNCISNTSADHTILKPTVTYVGETIALEPDVSAVMVKAGTKLPITANTSQLETISMDSSVAEVSFENNMVTITGVSDGQTKLFLKEGAKSKIVNVTVTSQEQPYRIWFEGAPQTTPDSNFRIYVHINTGKQILSGNIQYTVAYDNQELALIDIWDKENTQANAQGRYTASASLGISNSDTFNDGYTKGNYKYTTKSRVSTLYMKTIGDAPETEVSIEDIMVNGTYIQKELCDVSSKTITIHQNPSEDRNGDGLVSVGDVAKAAADGDDAETLKAISEKSGFYPVKRVFVIGMDGAGNAMDPDNAWFWDKIGEPRKFQKGEKPEEYRWKFFEETMMPNGAYTFDALSCTPSASAQNWTAILHGYRYSDGTGYEKIENNTASSNYFPEESKYSSFMKVAREEMPNRRQMTHINWTPIDNGMIEQSVGAWIVPWSSRIGTYSYERDVAIANGIAEQINQGLTKNMSVLFCHMDVLDNYGEHKDGFFTDTYYREEAQRKDQELQTIYEAIFNNEDIKDDSIMICTTDHGGYKMMHAGNSNIYSEKYSFVSLNGSVINPNYKWGGDPSITDEKEKFEDKTRTETCDFPLIVAKALGLTPDPDWKGQLKGAEGAFLEQTEMTKKNRDVERVTYTQDGEIHIKNLKNRITAMDLTLSYTGDSVPELRYAQGTQELYRSVDEDGKTIHVILVNETGFGLSAVQASAGIAVRNVMLANPAGKEIYADITEDTDEPVQTRIQSVTDGQGSALTIKNAVTSDTVRVTVTAGEMPAESSVAVAVYDEAGAMLGLETAELGADAQAVTIENPAQGLENAARIKVMWMEKPETLKPVCEAMTIQ